MDQVTNYNEDLSNGTENQILLSSRSNFYSENNFIRRLCTKAFPTGFCHEFMYLFTLTWPILITFIGESLIGPISLMFCGHLNDVKLLDAAGLAISIINMSVVAVTIGMATACTAVFSQCYGHETTFILGLFVQKALIIFILASMVVVSFHINMRYILIGAGQDEEIAILTGEFINLFIPGTISYFVFIVLRNYLQSLNIVIPNMIITIIGNIINCILQYLFLYHYSWKTWGSALAMSISYTSILVLYIVYILSSGIYKNTWNGWSWKCLENWGTFYTLAFFGMVAGCVETWSFEIGVIISGIIGKTYLGAQAVLSNIEMSWLQIPFGISTANCVRVSQYLGSGNTEGAVTVTRVSLVTTALISIIIPSVLFGLKDFVISVFTLDSEIAVLSSELYPILYCLMFVDGISFVCKGVLYAAGKHVFVGVFTFISCWCICIPIVIPLMLKTYFRTTAFWISIVIVIFIQDVILLTVIHKLKWEEVSREAQERTTQDDDFNSEGTPSDVSFNRLLIKRIVTFTFIVSIFCISLSLYICL